MPATYFYLLGTFFLFAFIFGVIIFFRRTLKKNQDQYELRIRGLEHDLAAANTQLGQHAGKLKSVQESSEFEKFASLVVAHMDRGVVIINQNRTLSLINDYAKQFLDLAATAGSSYKEVIHVRVQGVADNYTPFEESFAGKIQYLSGNIELVSQHGTFPISGTIIPLKTGDTVRAVAFIFEDYSKQVARVKEEQAFFSAAAHELRTPLTIIRMTVSLLRDKFEALPKEKVAEHLRRTDETTERLVKLVNDFLNISRIDQGRLDLKTEKFDIVTLVDEVLGSHTLLAKEHNLYIHHEKNAGQRMVMADRAKSAEVLSNLISNGLKYTIQGGLTITYTVTGTTCSVIITDTGAGIPKESQSLLFKRFGQVGAAHQLVPTKSTGLGLYISKKLAQLMRGDVQLVKSDPGTGSTFVFILPLERTRGTP